MKWFAFVVILFAAGCASTPEDETKTAAELYAEANDFKRAANYIAADAKFEELSSTYPTSRYAQQAILDQLHSFYRRKKYENAIDAANQFINLYPDNPNVPYAMYMKGIIHFREDRGFLDRIGEEDPSERDSSLMKLSYEAFEELITTFPESRFSPDATKRMRYLVNSLARYEIHVARYYHERGAYLATIARINTLLASYPDSDSTEAALVILLDAYKQLGSNEGVANTRRLLELNFPENTALMSGS